MDVKELISKAAEEEEKSYKFYMDTIDLTEDATARLWLGDLAGEELKHKHEIELYYDDIIFSED